MTTGSYTIGAPKQALYAAKTWNGADDPAHKAWNPYIMSHARQTRAPASRYRTTTGAYIDSPLLYGTTLWRPSFTLFDANDELSLLAKLADAVRDHSFNAAVSGAELGQTLALIRDRATSIFSAIRSARKGDFAKALHILVPGAPKRKFKSKDISGFWLEVQYGWRPLLRDIYEGMRFVESLTAGPRHFSVEASMTKRLKSQVSNSPPTYSIVADGSVSRKYRLEFTEQLSTARSLGLLNPEAVLWEKLPWSFVLDWFIPIGTYLDVISVLPSLNASLKRTDFARASAKYSAPAMLDQGYYTVRGGGVDYETTAMQRYAPTAVTRSSIPFPTLNAITKAFSLGHIKNTAALVWSGVWNKTRH